LGHSTPGTEFICLLFVTLEPLEVYEDFDSLLDYYLAELHKKNPATQTYTKKMLLEDIAMVAAIYWIAIVPITVSLFGKAPENPLWKIMGPYFKRYKLCI
jgi:hypothetical protein